MFEKFSVLSQVGVVYYVGVIGQVSLQILEFVTVPNSFDPNQTRRFVGYTLGPNCLQRPMPRDHYRMNSKRDFKGVHFWC